MTGTGDKAGRRTWVVALSAILAIGVATVIAMFVLHFIPDVHQAQLRLHTARPWLISLQIATLGLAWHQWPRLVAVVARRLVLAPSRREALLRSRSRVFALLACCELLILLRAFTA